MPRSLLFPALSLAILIAFAPSARALDPHKSITQYTRAFWTQADGLPQDNIRAIAQTIDGYLWVGTDEGLARFDGYDFITYTKDSGALPSNTIASLTAGRDGSLWIGTSNGLVRYRNGVFKTFTTKDGLPDNVIMGVLEDQHATLWIVAGVFLTRFEHSKFITYPASDLRPASTARTIVADHQGVWVAGIGGLAKSTGGRFSPVLDLPRINEGGFVLVARDRKNNTWAAGMGIVELGADGKVRKFDARDGLPSASVRAIAEDRDGNLWVGTTEGLSRLEGGKFVPQVLDNKPHEGYVHCLLEDREGNLWVGMNNGLYRFRDDEVTNYGRMEGLPSDEPIAVHQDQAGRVWVGYHGDGVTVVGERNAPHFTKKDGLLSDQIYAIRENRAGDLMIMTAAGINVLHGSSLSTYVLPQPGARYFVDFLQDRRGEIWLGTSSGLSRLVGQHVESLVPTVAGGPFQNDAAVVLAEGFDGSIWAGTYGEGLWHFQDQKVRRITIADGMASDKIRALLPDSDQTTLWIGTFGGGLNALRNGVFTNYTAKDGLLSDNIAHIDDDGAGSLWLATTRGVCRISKHQLSDFSAGKLHALTPLNYTGADGLRSAQCAPGIPVGGGGTRATDGRLWFPTARSLAVIDPNANLKHVAEKAPIVHLVAVTVDGHELSLGSTAKLKAGSDHLQFRYTGIHLSAPERVRYEYKLEGLDQDWNSAADRRVINFNTLHHGSYRFRVRASVTANASNEASFAFEVLPHFYEQRSFVWLCVASLIGAILSLHLLRLRQMRSRFALVLDERTRIAREIHDTLAQGFFGISSQLDALSLKMSGQSPAAQQHLYLARKMARHSITESRRSVMNLRESTIEDRDLPSALARAARQWSAGTSTRVETEFNGFTRALPAQVEQNTFRIAQEAVTNALKHANARSIRIRLMLAHERLELSVQDDGQGFEHAGAFSTVKGHYGLLGMRERAEHMGGEMRFSSEPDRGTIVSVNVPLTPGNGRQKWRRLIGAMRVWRRPLIP